MNNKRAMRNNKQAAYISDEEEDKEEIKGRDNRPSRQHLPSSTYD